MYTIVDQHEVRDVASEPDSKRILITYDEESLQQPLSTRLLQKGCTVLTAQTAEEGVSFLQNANIDIALPTSLVILMSGWALKEQEDTGHENR